MTDKEFYQKVLGLEEPWRVEEVKLDMEARRVELRVGYKAGGVWEVEGKKVSVVYDHAPERRWRHLDTCQLETILVAKVPRVKLQDGRVVTVPVPWAQKNSRFTLMFEGFAIQMLQCASSVSKACEFMGIDWEAAHRIMERAVERGLEARSLDDLKYAGMDEKSFLRGQSFVSLLYDLEGRRVLEVTEGRDQEAADFLWATMPEKTLGGIEAVCMDMSAGYEASARREVPQACIVNDRFHVSKHLNEAVDIVRRAEAKALADAGDERLKGTRQLWLYNFENLPESRQSDFEDLKKSDLKVAKAWAMKENFRAFWSCHSIRHAKAFFTKWRRWVSKSGLPSMVKVAATLKAHLPNLLNFILHPISNALAEGMNSKIQAIKSSARGFRNFFNYRTRILFFCGSLLPRPL